MRARLCEHSAEGTLSRGAVCANILRWEWRVWGAGAPWITQQRVRCSQRESQEPGYGTESGRFASSSGIPYPAMQVSAPIRAFLSRSHTDWLAPGRSTWARSSKGRERGEWIVGVVYCTWWTLAHPAPDCSLSRGSVSSLGAMPPSARPGTRHCYPPGVLILKGTFRGVGLGSLDCFFMETVESVWQLLLIGSSLLIMQNPQFPAVPTKRYL